MPIAKEGIDGTSRRSATVVASTGGKLVVLTAPGEVTTSKTVPVTNSSLTLSTCSSLTKNGQHVVPVLQIAHHSNVVNVTEPVVAKHDPRLTSLHFISTNKAEYVSPFVSSSVVTKQTATSRDTIFTTPQITSRSISAEPNAKSTFNGNKSTTKSGKSTTKGDKSTVKGDKSTVKGDKSTVNGDKSTVKVDKSTVKGDKSTVKGDKSTVKDDKSRSSLTGATSVLTSLHDNIHPTSRFMVFHPTEDSACILAQISLSRTTVFKVVTFSNDPFLATFDAMHEDPLNYRFRKYLRSDSVFCLDSKESDSPKELRSASKYGFDDKHIKDVSEMIDVSRSTPDLIVQENDSATFGIMKKDDTISKESVTSTALNSVKQFVHRQQMLETCTFQVLSIDPVNESKGCTFKNFSFSGKKDVSTGSSVPLFSCNISATPYPLNLDPSVFLLNLHSNASNLKEEIANNQVVNDGTQGIVVLSPTQVTASSLLENYSDIISKDVCSHFEKQDSGYDGSTDLNLANTQDDDIDEDEDEDEDDVFNEDCDNIDLIIPAFDCDGKFIPDEVVTANISTTTVASTDDDEKTVKTKNTKHKEVIEETMRRNGNSRIAPVTETASVPLIPPNEAPSSVNQEHYQIDNISIPSDVTFIGSIYTNLSRMGTTRYEVLCSDFECGKDFGIEKNKNAAITSATARIKNLCASSLNSTKKFFDSHPSLLEVSNSDIHLLESDPIYQQIRNASSLNLVGKDSFILKKSDKDMVPKVINVNEKLDDLRTARKPAEELTTKHQLETVMPIKKVLCTTSEIIIEANSIPPDVVQKPLMMDTAFVASEETVPITPVTENENNNVILNDQSLTTPVIGILNTVVHNLTEIMIPKNDHKIEVKSNISIPSEYQAVSANGLILPRVNTSQYNVLGSSASCESMTRDKVLNTLTQTTHLQKTPIFNLLTTVQNGPTLLLELDPFSQQLANASKLTTCDPSCVPSLIEPIVHTTPNTSNDLVVTNSTQSNDLSKEKTIPIQANNVFINIVDTVSDPLPSLTSDLVEIYAKDTFDAEANSVSVSLQETMRIDVIDSSEEQANLVLSNFHEQDDDKSLSVAATADTSITTEAMSYEMETYESNVNSNDQSHVLIESSKEDDDTFSLLNLESVAIDDQQVDSAIDDSTVAVRNSRELVETKSKETVNKAERDFENEQSFPTLKSVNESNSERHVIVPISFQGESDHTEEQQHSMAINEALPIESNESSSTPNENVTESMDKAVPVDTISNESGYVSSTDTSLSTNTIDTNISSPATVEIIPPAEDDAITGSDATVVKSAVEVKVPNSFQSESDHTEEQQQLAAINETLVIESNESSSIPNENTTELTDEAVPVVTMSNESANVSSTDTSISTKTTDTIISSPTTVEIIPPAKDDAITGSDETVAKSPMQTTALKSDANVEKTDFTVYGATSFVSKHVMKYFMHTCMELPIEFKLTLAGRDKEKLLKLKLSLEDKMNSLRVINENHSFGFSFDVFVADSSNVQALNEMARRTKIVINCAGPYVLYGSNVVGACAQNGTDYVDITGEARWSGQMRVKYGQAAKASGARIISFCGFDSIPSDLSIFAAVMALRQRVKDPASLDIANGTTWHFVDGGGLNGGTIATLVNTSFDYKTCFSQPVPFFIDDPLVLAHPMKRFDPDLQATKNAMAKAEWWNQLPKFESFLNLGVSAPFFMAAVNAKVVHASAIALNYGRNFTYRERFVPLGYFHTARIMALSIIPALMVQLASALLIIILKLPFIGQKVVNTFFPPGSGPSDERCRLGKGEVYAEVTSSKDEKGQIHRANCYLKFKGDAGNYITSQCLCESAWSLLLNRTELPPRSEDGFGTPAELLGDVVLRRMVHSKVRPVTIAISARLNVPQQERIMYR